MKMFLQGKTALVTGGGGTIGRAIAKALLFHGATVVLTGRRIESLEETKQTLLLLLQQQQQKINHFAVDTEWQA